MNFSLWLETRKWNWVYHATYFKNIPEISDHGLIPNGSTSNWDNYTHWVRNKIFFSENLSNAKYWIGSLQEQVFQKYESAIDNPDNFVNQNLIPVIVKFRFNRRPNTKRWQRDEEGLEGDYFSHKSINSNGIYWWDGTKWKETVEDRINYNLFVYKNLEEGYWEFVEPYPFPR